MEATVRLKDNGAAIMKQAISEAEDTIAHFSTAAP